MQSRRKNSKKPQDNRPLALNWGSNELLPLNIPAKIDIQATKRTVSQEVLKDIYSSKTYLILTGYTSLEYIIDTFYNLKETDNPQEIIIVLGNEPDRKPTRKSWGKVSLETEIKDYWLAIGYSILKSSRIIRVIELVKAERIKFRILNNFHAKIYLCEDHAVLGSSNFSWSGMNSQQEANIRVTSNSNSKSEQNQYQNISLTANNYLQLSTDYTSGILQLLHEVVEVVQWQEALSRAIAELVEDNWFKELPELYEKLNGANLWSFQLSGLRQAMHILQNYGCVLIADAAGSGKTKLIQALTVVLSHYLWETGKKNSSNTSVVCPPLVQNNWEQEAEDIKLSQSSPVSMGLLSQQGNQNYQRSMRKVESANILIVDEAHHYLNLNSNRSESLSKHLADYTILTTATPINKRTRDLIRIVELLGLDNLSDEDLEKFRRLKKMKLSDSSEDVSTLYSYISKLIVRRTKKQLKTIIRHKPESHKNKFGVPCQCPEVITRTYSTGESENDRCLASQIYELAGNLKGLIYLRTLEAPLDCDENNLPNYIKMRLKAAEALAAFNIQARLRSSRAALLELIEGTDSATNYFGFKSNKAKSGNFVEILSKYKNGLPKILLPCDLLPDWLVNLDLYKKACESEIQIYLKIRNLLKEISGQREETKVRQLIDLLKKEALVIAFDSSVVTLDYMKHLISERYKEIDVIVATGQTSNIQTIKKFGLGSNVKSVVGLFSDCMSEGVNLQQASAVVFLDTPSILRIAEQRIGRVDRLDSPHKEIYVYWSSDSDEFALKTDKRLIKTIVDAKSLIGSNFEIPDEMLIRHIDEDESLTEQENEIVRPQEIAEMLREVEELDYPWDGIQDPFQAVHALYEGKDSLISQEDYLELKNVRSTVKAKISYLKSQKAWIFIAMKGTKYSPPRWYFVDSSLCIYSDFTAICKKLKEYLHHDMESTKWTSEMDKELEKYFNLLKRNEVELLPNKQKRALRLAEFAIRQVIQNTQDLEEKDIYIEALKLFKPSLEDEASIDYSEFARQWLQLFKPHMQRVKDSKKNKNCVVCLADLEQDPEFANISFNAEALKKIVLNSIVDPIQDRVAACIIGMPSESELT